VKIKVSSYLYLILTFFIWGSYYVVSKFVLGKMPVLTVAELRLAIAGIALFAIIELKKLPKIQKEDYKDVFLIGILGYFLAPDAQLLGIKFTTASISSLINSLNPVLIMLMAAFFLKETLTARKIIGIMMSLFGVCIILDLGGTISVAGIVLCFLSIMAWSLATIKIRKFAQKYDAIVLLAYTILVGFICNLPLEGYELVKTNLSIRIDLPCLCSLLYLGLVCTSIANYFWNKSLASIEAGTCSAFYPLQPLSSVALGIIFLGEQLTASFVAGAFVIVCGVVLSLFQKNTRPLTGRDRQHPRPHFLSGNFNDHFLSRHKNEGQ
jgi:drug/metabolite transporter (DMT)-like permease